MYNEKSVIGIRIAGLADGVHNFDFTCKSSDFAGWQLEDAGFTRVIEVGVVAEKSGDKIDVTINTSTVADFACDICLAPNSRVLTGSLRLSYFIDPSLCGGQSENEEYRILDRSVESIDITADVCETLLLSLPLKVTCIDNIDCHLYSSIVEHEGPQAEEKTLWHDSLEKLKNKYR